MFLHYNTRNDIELLLLINQVLSPGTIVTIIITMYIIGYMITICLHKNYISTLQ